MKYTDNTWESTDGAFQNHVFSRLSWKAHLDAYFHLETTSNGRPEWEDHRYTIPCEGVLTSP